MWNFNASYECASVCTVYLLLFSIELNSWTLSKPKVYFKHKYFEAPLVEKINISSCPICKTYLQQSYQSKLELIVDNFPSTRHQFERQDTRRRKKLTPNFTKAQCLVKLVTVQNWAQLTRKKGARWLEFLHCVCELKGEMPEMVWCAMIRIIKSQFPLNDKERNETFSYLLLHVFFLELSFNI